MKKRINKSEFEILDFDSKCVIIEQVLTDDYFSGQAEIFSVPEDFKGEIGKDLLEESPELKQIELKKFEELLEKLTIKIFEAGDEIEYEENN